jgi:hypothetical protein
VIGHEIKIQDRMVSLANSRKMTRPIRGDIGSNALVREPSPTSAVRTEIDKPTALL